MSSPPRWAMVFAAGRGERMRPLSDVLPKPALPLPGGPLIQSALRLVAACGARRVVVNSWHLAERMEAAVQAVRSRALAVRFSREGRLMGTAGGLALARERGLLGGDGPVMVANGDCLLDLDLAPLLERHARGGDLVTLALLPHPEPRRWSRVELDGEGRVTRFSRPGPPRPGERPFLYTGVMLVARAALSDLPVAEGGVGEVLWPLALREGRLGGAVVHGSWREVGEPDGYLAAVLELLQGRNMVVAGAMVAGDATLRAALVGEGVQVGAGAVVEESVVAAGAVVGAGARIRRSVLLGAVQAGDGEVVDGEVRAAAPSHHRP